MTKHARSHTARASLRPFSLEKLLPTKPHLAKSAPSSPTTAFSQGDSQFWECKAHTARELFNRYEMMRTTLFPAESTEMLPNSGELFLLHLDLVELQEMSRLILISESSRSTQYGLQINIHRSQYNYREALLIQKLQGEVSFEIIRHNLHVDTALINSMRETVAKMKGAYDSLMAQYVPPPCWSDRPSFDGPVPS